MHCHAGCDTKSILSAIGLTEKDLFNNEEKQKPKLDKEYFYRDEKGIPLYKVMRFIPKNFMQARYVSGEWVYKMTGVRYVPYNLPNVIKSDVVYFVEGEKDADNLNAIGLVATTTAGGAASFKKKSEEYAKFFKDKTVYILPDNDKAGNKYAEDIQTALKSVSKEVEILQLSDEIKDLKEKEDISDVIQRYGKDFAIQTIKDLIVRKHTKVVSKVEKKEKTEYFEDIEISKESVLSIDLMEKLYAFELQNGEKFIKFYMQIKNFCSKNKITGFDRTYKLYKESKQEKYIYQNNVLMFPGLTDTTYNADRYELTPEGFIYEIIPNVGRMLVSFQPIIPFKKYINIEDGTEKIEIAFLHNKEWKNLIVDKSIVSSSQAIVKLSDFGVNVTSENAKPLVKYLAVIENINRDKIPVLKSVSRLGWFGEELIPYNDSFEFDNAKDFPNLKEKFGESGTLEDWVDFFKERRMFNPIARIVMASSVASILLKYIKQPGFTLHIWGQSEYGKTVSSMVAQSIFGNPSQSDNKGIGINFNFTSAGLEYKLNLFNNIPLFVNEMQHQKDAKDYDKILFLVSEGKGKSRATKLGGIARENSWNNIVLTNGEKDIIKDNSNAGAYNRCISCEIKDYAYEKLNEVADFVKENYGTPIRKILEHLKDYDIKAIYKEMLKKLNDIDITNKRKILVAIILLGDKILTDIIFKDEKYLQLDDFEIESLKTNEIATEERAYEVVRDWYISEKRHFLDVDENKVENENLKFEIFGKEMGNGFISFIPKALRDVLQDNGYDYKEVISAWNRKGYIKHERGRNTSNTRINGVQTRCIILDIKKDLESDYNADELPF